MGRKFNFLPSSRRKPRAGAWARLHFSFLGDGYRRIGTGAAPRLQLFTPPLGFINALVSCSRHLNVSSEILGVNLALTV